MAPSPTVDLRRTHSLVSGTCRHSSHAIAAVSAPAAAGVAAASGWPSPSGAQAWRTRRPRVLPPHALMATMACLWSECKDMNNGDDWYNLWRMGGDHSIEPQLFAGESFQLASSPQAVWRCIRPFGDAHCHIIMHLTHETIGRLIVEGVLAPEAPACLLRGSCFFGITWRFSRSVRVSDISWMEIHMRPIGPPLGQRLWSGAEAAVGWRAKSCRGSTAASESLCATASARHLASSASQPALLAAQQHHSDPARVDQSGPASRLVQHTLPSGPCFLDSESDTEVLGGEHKGVDCVVAR